MILTPSLVLNMIWILILMSSGWNFEVKILLPGLSSLVMWENIDSSYQGALVRVKSCIFPATLPWYNQEDICYFPVHKNNYIYIYLYIFRQLHSSSTIAHYHFL